MEFYRYNKNIDYSKGGRGELEIFKTIYASGEDRVELIFGVILRLTPDGKIDPLYIQTGFEAMNLQAKICVGGKEFVFLFGKEIIDKLDSDRYTKLDNIPLLYKYNRNRIGFLLDILNNPGQSARALGRSLRPEEYESIKTLLVKEYNQEIPTAVAS